MVHGVGSLGGGGGFNGSDICSGLYISTNNYSYTRRRNRHRHDSCDKCMGGVFHWFCCVGQSYLNKILIFWAWLVVLTLITGLSVGLGRFGPTDIQVSPSDMMQMERGIDPVFCEGVSVQTTLPVSTYLLPSHPVVASERVDYSFNKTSILPPNKYEYWGFYLLAGSDVEITACSDRYPNLYIIKGETQFTRWKNDYTDVDNRQELHYIGRCSDPQFSKPMVSYHVSNTEEYYFLILNDGLSTLHFNILFNLSRAVYDLGSDENIVCRNSTSCTVEFAAAGSKNAIVVYVPLSDEFNFVIKTDCLSRVSVFIAIFLLIPFVMGSLFTVYMLYRKRKSSNTIAIGSVQGGKQRTLTSYPPNYQTIERHVEQNRPPPSHSCHGDGIAVKPPTYDESVVRNVQT